MRSWRKAAAICMTMCLLLSTAVYGSSTQDPESGAANTTVEAAETGNSGADTAGEEKQAESAAEPSDEAGTQKPAADTAETSDEAGTQAPAAENADQADSSAQSSDEEAVVKSIPNWSEDSAAMASIMAYVESVSDESSIDYVAPAERIAVFDMDGTLYGELFPTYFDQCMLMYRLLHDETYTTANEEDKAFAKSLEDALLHGKPEPDSPRSTAQMSAESFKGYTVDDYRQYIHTFMGKPAVGFENMTYGEAFYQPMVSLVQYLAEHDFKVYICSGTERSLARELTKETLGEWIPPYQIIGTTYSLTATGQGDTAGRDYTYTADDKVLMEGNMTYKNLKMNKVCSIVDEIGVSPLLAFGNSSGDFAMAQYVVQNGGKAYMLLCDDTERDYGDTEKAASFAEKCKGLGFETVSMKNEFETIYGADVKKTQYLTEEQEAAPAEETAPAQENAPAQEAAPAQETAPAQEAAPDGQTAPQEQTTPEEEEMKPAA